MKKNILVVDDSVFMLTTISDTLKGLGYDVTCAKNGLVACHNIETTRFDMIITDLNMPGMCGIELTKKIKSHPNCKFVPIVLLSDEKDQEKVFEAKKAGISTFLSKPLNTVQLKSLLQITLSKRKEQRYPVKLEVFYGEDNILADFEAGYSYDLSEGGVFIMTSNPLPSNEKLRVKLYLPDKELPVTCLGRVAWVSSSNGSHSSKHPAGMGVEFKQLSDQLALKSFLREHTSRRVQH